MIDARFSVEAFRGVGPDTAAAEALSQELGGEIAAAVGEAIGDALHCVIAQLRGLGHDLREKERGVRLPFNAYDCTFGPSVPLTPGGSLLIGVHTYALAIFVGLDPEPFVAGRREQDGPPTDDTVPF